MYEQGFFDKKKLFYNIFWRIINNVIIQLLDYLQYEPIDYYDTFLVPLYYYIHIFYVSFVVVICISCKAIMQCNSVSQCAMQFQFIHTQEKWKKKKKLLTTV